MSGTGSGVRETRFNFQKVDIGTEEAIGIRKVLDEPATMGEGGAQRDTRSRRRRILVGTRRAATRDPTRVCGAVRQPYGEVVTRAPPGPYPTRRAHRVRATSTGSHSGP